MTSLDYSDFLGRVAIARVFQAAAGGTEVGIAKLNGTIQPTKIIEAVHVSWP